MRRRVRSIYSHRAKRGGEEECKPQWLGYRDLEHVHRHLIERLQHDSAEIFVYGSPVQMYNYRADVQLSHTLKSELALRPSPIVISASTSRVYPPRPVP